MRSKAPLALMELIIMVLVFALSAALCLRIFAFSDSVSRRNQQRDQAVLLAQNMAETVKTSRGANVPQTVWYDENGMSVLEETAAVYRLDVQPLETDVPGLGEAEIRVCPVEAEAPLFSLNVAWQEVSGNG